MKLVLLFASAALVAGHGMLNYPPTRVAGGTSNQESAGQCSGNDPSKVPQAGTCLWFNQGCQVGCGECTGGTSNFCDHSTGKQPTIDALSDLRTYKWPSKILDTTKYNPWRAPGFAPIINPCGIAGGYDTEGKPGNGGVPPQGIKQGMKGTDLPPVPKEKRAVWKKGSIQEASWDITANHGGGYQYRLCSSDKPLTEECFQGTPIPFVGDTQFIQWGVDKTTRREIKAMRTSVGTNPLNSTWTRNPIPACDAPAGGALHEGCDSPNFEPPLGEKDIPYPSGAVGKYKKSYGAGLYGFGSGTCTSGLPGDNCTADEYVYWAELFNFNIIDKIQVPTNIPAGEYVLSFRWDCEQTPQIWAGCADVTITE